MIIVKSIYISRTVFNREVYKAFKRAYNNLYRHGNDLVRHHAFFYQETGCRIAKICHTNDGRFKNAVIEFDRDKDYTMFMLRWS